MLDELNCNYLVMLIRFTIFCPERLRPGKTKCERVDIMTVSSDGLGKPDFKSRLVNLGRNILKNKGKYVLVLPGLVWYVIFAYIPIFGLSLAFKKYMAKMGLFGSPWVGLANFENVFADPAFLKSIYTTLWINAGRLIFVFPVPIILALLFNEVRLGRSKKILQSIFTFPHFLSWVIVGSNDKFLGQRGVVNSLLNLLFGTDPIDSGEPSYSSRSCI